MRRVSVSRLSVAAGAGFAVAADCDVAADCAVIDVAAASFLDIAVEAVARRVCLAAA